MPRSVERALADSLSLGHPDVPWTPPATLPAVAELRLALDILDGQGQTGEHHAGFCLSKMVMAFEPNTKLTAEQTRLRLAVWLEANGDLGDELWSIATLAAIQGSQWMPKPAEFRKLVQARFDERQRRKERCRAMLHALGGKGQKPFQREPEPVRVRASRDTFRRIGNIAKAALYERRLAEIETREPEAWAIKQGSAP
ncbi:MAG: hypothetical protein GEV13_13625 [Rhodospirillales bacterium]|nr:hypothetical protein [Rhodospirillales bacterium]